MWVHITHPIVILFITNTESFSTIRVGDVQYVYGGFQSAITLTKLVGWDHKIPHNLGF